MISIKNILDNKKWGKYFVKNNIDEILNNPIFDKDLNDISEDFIPTDAISLKKFKEKLLTERISIDTYFSCLDKINWAFEEASIKNPLEYYLLLKNANVVVTMGTNFSELKKYKDENYLMWNTLIDNCAMKYINELEESFMQNGSIPFNQFMEVYNIFERVKGCKVDTSRNMVYELIRYLSEVSVKNDNSVEMIYLINMKIELLSYVDSYKKGNSKGL